MIKFVPNDHVVYRWAGEGGHNRYFEACVKSVHGHLVRIALKIKGGEHHRDVDPSTLMLQRRDNLRHRERNLWNCRSNKR